jgi:acetylornithine deacetylase/succinyl-diaminopimelate desuccinylase-like protein
VMAGQSTGSLRQAMAAFAANPRDPRAEAVLEKDPAYNGVTHTTCVPTLLRGGHADNALPQSATATINCRIFPGVSLESVRDTLQGLVGPHVEVTIFNPGTVSAASPIRPEVMNVIARLVHSEHPGIPIVPSMEMGATDGVFYRSIGIPTYGTSEVFLKPSDDFSHGLNERIPVVAFYNGLEFWYQLLQAVGSPQP